MAITEFGTNNGLTRKIWQAKSEQLFRDAPKNSFFNKFMSTTGSSIVHVKNELESEAGDRITFGLRMRNTGGGVSINSTLEGNEESLTTYSYNLTLTGRRFAISHDGLMSAQRVQMNLEKECMDSLTDQVTEYMDEQLFSALRTSPTAVWYNNNGTITKDTAANAKSDIVASQDKITPELISGVRAWARTGGNRAQTPLSAIRDENGREAYVLLVHPDVAFDLKNDSTYAQANREAQIRGERNPIFTGALGVWDNVVIHEHENIHIGTDAGAGSDQPYAECYLMGQQALCWAFGKKGQIIPEIRDYGKVKGYGYNLIFAAGKPNFNSLDYGSVGVFVGRTQISDA